MVEHPKKPRLVGNFIRERREALGLSQRALGLLFSPPVTTQFISNVERGVTPLPPAHVPMLTKALMVSEAEMTGLLEKEYTLKLSGRLGRGGGEDMATLENGVIEARSAVIFPAGPSVAVTDADYLFIKSLYDAYKQADQKTKQTFASVCESILSVSKRQ